MEHKKSRWHKKRVGGTKRSRWNKIRVDQEFSKSRCLTTLVTPWACSLKAERRLLPTCWVHTHEKKMCSKLLNVGVGHCLQLGEELGIILATLSSEGKILWRSFHKKLVASEPRPLSLARFQVNSQSVLGDANSVLELMYCIVWSSISTMVISFSNSTLYHWAVVIVATFRGVFSFTHLIQLKNDSL